MVTAKNNATVKGAINGKGVMVAAAEGDANTGNIDAKSGHATVTAGQDATIGDVTAGGNAEIVAKRDATTGAITAADGSVTVVTKNNATIDGAINGRVVIVEAIEGDVSLKGDATASAGYLFVRAGQDAKVAADATLKSETSYVSVVAGNQISAGGRDIGVYGRVTLLGPDDDRREARCDQRDGRHQDGRRHWRHEHQRTERRHRREGDHA